MFRRGREPAQSIPPKASLAPPSVIKRKPAAVAGPRTIWPTPRRAPPPMSRRRGDWNLRAPGISRPEHISLAIDAAKAGATVNECLPVCSPDPVWVAFVISTFDKETTKRQRDTVRAAKLAVLKIQAQQTAEHIDATARQVETLAQVAAAMTDELFIPAISRIGADLRSSNSDWAAVHWDRPLREQTASPYISGKKFRAEKLERLALLGGRFSLAAAGFLSRLGRAGGLYGAGAARDDRSCDLRPVRGGNHHHRRGPHSGLSWHRGDPRQIGRGHHRAARDPKRRCRTWTCRPERNPGSGRTFGAGGGGTQRHGWRHERIEGSRSIRHSVSDGRWPLIAGPGTNFRTANFCSTWWGRNDLCRTSSPLWSRNTSVGL